jgi:hypothetical protein
VRIQLGWRVPFAPWFYAHFRLLCFEGTVGQKFKSLDDGSVSFACAQALRDVFSVVRNKVKEARDRYIRDIVIVEVVAGVPRPPDVSRSFQYLAKGYHPESEKLTLPGQIVWPFILIQTIWFTANGSGCELSPSSWLVWSLAGGSVACTSLFNEFLQWLIFLCLIVPDFVI